MSCNETVLEGVSYYPAQFCVTSVIGSYLKYRGIDLLADILGKYWEFEFNYTFPSGFFSASDIRYHVRPTSRSYSQILKEDFGVRFRNIYAETEKGEIIERICRLIDDGFPVIVSVDPFYLDYYENYGKFHGMNWNHYILIFGYSKVDQEILFIDSTRAFINGPKHKIQFSRLYDCIMAENDIYRQSPEVIILDIPPLGPAEYELYYSDSRQDIDRDAHRQVTKHTYTGIDGIKVFAGELRKIACSGDAEFQKKVVYCLVNHIVLLNQHRLGNNSYLSKFVPAGKDALDGICKHWEKIKFSMSPVRIKNYEERLAIIANYIELAAAMEEDFINGFIGGHLRKS